MRRIFYWLIVWGILLVVGVSPTNAQERSLIDRYQAAHFQVRVEQMIHEQGWEVAPHPPDRVSTPQTDSLRAWLRRATRTGEERVQEPAFPLSERRVIRRPARNWFRHRFADARWSFLGRVGLTSLDTTLTRDLRARLEAHFGPPTVTLADLEHDPGELRDQYVQFEYWFVVNDSIPVKVMDTNGPFGRGLVLAAAARYREHLPALRRALLASLLRDERRASYVDYYFDPQMRTWYLTGYDGDEFFLRQASHPPRIPGRRPRL